MALERYYLPKLIEDGYASGCRELVAAAGEDLFGKNQIRNDVPLDEGTLKYKIFEVPRNPELAKNDLRLRNHDGFRCQTQPWSNQNFCRLRGNDAFWKLGMVIHPSHWFHVPGLENSCACSTRCVSPLIIELQQIESYGFFCRENPIELLMVIEKPSGFSTCFFMFFLMKTHLFQRGATRWLAASSRPRRGLPGGMTGDRDLGVPPVKNWMFVKFNLEKNMVSSWLKEKVMLLLTFMFWCSMLSTWCCKCLFKWHIMRPHHRDGTWLKSRDIAREVAILLATGAPTSKSWCTYLFRCPPGESDKNGQKRWLFQQDGLSNVELQLHEAWSYVIRWRNLRC